MCSGMAFSYLFYICIIVLNYILFLSFDFVSRFLKYGNRKQIIKELKVCKLCDSAWTFLDFYCFFFIVCNPSKL